MSAPLKRNAYLFFSSDFYDIMQNYRYDRFNCSYFFNIQNYFYILIGLPDCDDVKRMGSTAQLNPVEHLQEPSCRNYWYILYCTWLIIIPIPTVHHWYHSMYFQHKPFVLYRSSR
jgi:hypothetical protein